MKKNPTPRGILTSNHSFGRAWSCCSLTKVVADRTGAEVEPWAWAELGSPDVGRVLVPPDSELGIL